MVVGSALQTEHALSVRLALLLAWIFMVAQSVNGHHIAFTCEDLDMKNVKFGDYAFA